MAITNPRTHWTSATRTQRSVWLALLMGSGCIAACSSSSPNDTEFVQACLKTQATQPICECAAKEAKKLSAEHYRIMVLDMQGNKQEVAALADKMSLDQRAAFAQEQFEVLGKCADAK
jgi:hypothetical protein